MIYRVSPRGGLKSSDRLSYNLVASKGMHECPCAPPATRLRADTMSLDPDSRTQDGLSPTVASSPPRAPDQRPPPPAYAEAAVTTGARRSSGADAIVPPGTLYLASNQIYPGDDTGSSGASPLYELSLAVSFLRDRTSPVRLERLEYSVRQRLQHDHPEFRQEAAGLPPGVSVRRRHIYNLAPAPPRSVGGSGGGGYAADPEVRAALGPISVSDRRSSLVGSGGGGCQAWRPARSGGGGGRGAELLFEARPEGGGHGRVHRDDRTLQWFAYGQCAPDGEHASDGGDGSGDGGSGSSSSSGGGMGTGWLVAREDQDEAEGLYRLVVLAPLGRQARDALVAAWCCRICGNVVGGRGSTGLAKFKRVMSIIKPPESITLKQRYH
ncbi:hypothetical protein GGTG_06650 [Gaeumannomyces tritici R3-111a-1]|uniref:Uncharacterized protein n=1 Tax=Gaeumannomyces tritici (strain R3-111a-1) TaxID=644352 RepID=J3NZF1_GAET3|nr:hypothetical protein GGTG_06650 [Gaeumannomyces tritici R3-111a-1]EJT76734.1 hypothetical protein GGTG_06650 [Gaeumannomyces tritici R3-111a-1]